MLVQRIQKLVTVFIPLCFVACSSNPNESRMPNDDPQQSGESAPTYGADVAPLMTEHCVSCHTADGIAPFALETYADVAAHADRIKQVTASREMPPWNIDDRNGCMPVKNARWMSDDEIARIG